MTELDMLEYSKLQLALLFFIYCLNHANQNLYFKNNVNLQ